MRSRFMTFSVFVTCLFTIVSLPVRADRPDAGSSPEPPEPRVTLVLSGGGARGAAHIGVLRVLEELRVPVDLIVGTSMGSIIGGLYATGWSPGEIEHLLETTDFREVFVDHPERDDKSFRRKQDDLKVLIPLKLRFKGARPYIPPAALGGQRLELLLRTLELESTNERDFDLFPIPYRAVAADLATGEAVVLGSGSLATAMRASMSIAGVFAPVVVDGRKLVDGGAAANLPVGIAQDMGAGAIIAVDITTPLTEEEELTSLFSIFSQLTGFLTVGNRLEDIAKLTPGDVLITPDLGDIKFSSFELMVEAASRGEVAALSLADQLKRFSVSEEEYASYLAHHRRHPDAIPVPDDVRIENTSWVADQVVRRQVHIPPGEPIDVQTLNQDVRRLYALEYFGTIRTSFDAPGDQPSVLTLDTPLKPYGRNSLQFGIDFYDDFDGNAGYAFSARHQMLAVNRRGGEWQNTFQIGDTTLLDSQFYQPLDYGMKWFIEPAAGTRHWNQEIWFDGDPFTEYRIGITEVSLDAGRVFGRWGEARVGTFYSNNTATLRTGLSVFPDFHQKDGGLRFRFRVDTRDDVVFPEKGLFVDARYSHSYESLGADEEYSSYSVRVGTALTIGRNTFVPIVEAGSILDGPDLLSNTYFLGGFLRLSGLGQDELFGPQYGLATLIYYCEIKEINMGALSPRIYAGLSLEAGNTWAQGDSIGLDTLDHSGSVFLGARTPIGPVYIAYALADGGRRRVYFNIGTRF